MLGLLYTDVFNHSLINCELVIKTTIYEDEQFAYKNSFDIMYVNGIYQEVLYDKKPFSAWYNCSNSILNGIKYAELISLYACYCFSLRNPPPFLYINSKYYD